MNRTMTITGFTGGPIGTNAWLAGDDATGMDLLADAPRETGSPVRAALAKRGWTLTSIVLTHGHWDHIGDVMALARATGARIHAHAGDRELLERPTGLGGMLPFDMEPVVPDHWISEGDVVNCGGIALDVWHTPGHSPGGICLHAAGESLLISGDTLFEGSYGRTDLPGASEKEMWASLLRLASLPPDTRVLPGHGPETTVGAQRWLTSLAGAR